MEVSETIDNSDGVQKSSTAVSESSHEEKNVVINEEGNTTTNEDGYTTTVIIKKISVKNLEKDQVKMEKAEKVDEIVDLSEQKVEVQKEIASANDENENEEHTVVETGAVRTSDRNSQKIEHDSDVSTTTTTTKTTVKKKKVPNAESMEDTQNEEDGEIGESSTKQKVEQKVEKIITATMSKDAQNEPKTDIKVPTSEQKNEMPKKNGEIITIQPEIVKEIEKTEKAEEADDSEQEEEEEENEDEEDEQEKEETKEGEEKEQQRVEESGEVQEEETTKKKFEEKEAVTVSSVDPSVSSTSSDKVERESKEKPFEQISSSSPGKVVEDKLHAESIITHNKSGKVKIDVTAVTSTPESKPQQTLDVSNLTTREEIYDEGYIRKSEISQQNDIQNNGDGRREVHRIETKTTIQSSIPLSDSFYSTNLIQQKPHRFQQTPSSSSYSICPFESHDPTSHNQFLSEQTSTTKKVDLQKIFTPATDSDEISPKTNRKLYASSAFYSPNLHPTVEDQVELARRISHSLSDISNQQSKGQTMYVNRKKRSVKWVHEGEEPADLTDCNGYDRDEHKENQPSFHHEKLPLKLVMNPHGQVRDFTSVRQEYNTDSCLLSPDKCAELVAGLNAPKGKGAELFAKRRKKSEKWIVDETNAAQSSPSGVSPYGSASPNILPAYSDVGKHRVQLNMHQDHLTDLYAQQYGSQRVKMIKTPWEAALETGSAAAAFESDLRNLKQPSSFQVSQPVVASGNYYSPSQVDATTTPTDYQQSYHNEFIESSKLPKTLKFQLKTGWQPNSHRELAYKPSIPQGWNAPPTSLPRELYVPKEIPLDGYNPPSTEKYLPSNPIMHGSGLTSNSYPSSLYPSYKGLSSSATTTSDHIKNNEKSTWCTDNIAYASDNTTGNFEMKKSFPFSSASAIFETSNTTHQSHSNNCEDFDQSVQQQSSPKQYHFPNTLNRPPCYYSAPPTYKPLLAWKAKSASGVNIHPSTNFNPSPLPYEKLAKFENDDPDDTIKSYYPRHSAFIRSPSKARNLSPSPYLSSSISTSRQTQSASQYIQPASAIRNIPSPTPFNKLSPKPVAIYGSENDSNLNKCKNYNTAARGWDQSSCYKPITFGVGGHNQSHSTLGVATAGGALKMPYSDF